ncbi:MAG: AAA family ATPase, partial [Erysipelotrichaceae bacterium]|nr:AAA family ATPase [Erysipelotrichaceae bacterium]
MANVILIMGKSGTGKSTSIKTLNPDETVIINPLGKMLPFRGSNKLYNAEKKNSFQVSDWQQIINYLNSINTNVPNVKNIVLDDILYCMRTEFFN